MSDDEGISLLREIKGNLDQIKDRLAGGEVAVKPTPGATTGQSSGSATPTPENTNTGEPVLQTPASSTTVTVQEPENPQATVETPPEPKKKKPDLPWKRKASA